PVRPELGLETDQPGAANDQALAGGGRLGDLRLPVLGVVLKRLPGPLGDLGDRVLDPELQAHADRIGPARLLKPGEELVVPERRVGPEELLAAGAGTLNAGDQLLGEAQHPALAGRLPLAQPHVQDLAGVGPRREQRVIPAPLGVPETDPLLPVAMNLADEAVEVDHEALLTRASARPPRTRQCLCEHAVELAHMPEG